MERLPESGRRLHDSLIASLLAFGLLVTSPFLSAAQCEVPAGLSCSCPALGQVTGLKARTDRIKLKDISGKARDFSKKELETLLKKSGGKFPLVGKKGSSVYLCIDGQVLGGQRLYFRQDDGSEASLTVDLNMCSSLVGQNEPTKIAATKLTPPRALLSKERIAVYTEKCCSTPGMPCPRGK